VLVLNSLSGAEGLDGLQNVCHHLARFESNSRPDINKQQVKRLQRHGQQHTVFVTNFACRSSVDSRLLESIEAGHDLMSRVVDGRSFKALLGNTV
jgi:SNF2 family DNA or RNA helicase